jgi:peptidoglycan/xylan/chitin deacetylase (PgdA/CDA1 family)
MVRFYARPRRRARRRLLVGGMALGATALLAWLGWAWIGRPAPSDGDSRVARAPAAESEPEPPPPDIPASDRGTLIVDRLGSFDGKVIALTFDDGPDPVVTPAVLRTLKQFGAKATFFVMGGAAKANPDLVRQMVREGHAVESHTWSHMKRPSDADAVRELDRTADLIEELTGRRPQCFRPPYGFTTSAYTKAAVREKYCVLTWTLGSDDTAKIDSAGIANNIVQHPHPGAIVLLHDSRIHQSTASSLVSVLRTLTDAGWRFVTVPELLCERDRWRAERATKAPSSKPAAAPSAPS